MTIFVCGTCGHEVTAIIGTTAVTHICPKVQSGDRYRDYKVISPEALRQRASDAFMELAIGTTWDQCPIIVGIDVCENA